MTAENVAIPDGVGLTALGVAYVRATETMRPDRFFDDPLASEFVAASGWAPVREEVTSADDTVRLYWAGLQQWIVVRTRFLDEYVARATEDGCRQVVLLGAGLDARAFRLAWPDGVRLFEIDLPDVLAYKEMVVSRSAATSRCERIVVVSDLRGDWPSALRAAGFDPEDRTAWIAEGLLIYLSEDENDELLRRVDVLSAPGSRLAVTLREPRPIETHLDGEPIDANDPLATRASLTSMWRSTAPADPVSWLARYGWRAQVSDAVERS